MRWASNFLWYMARQSSSLSMPTGGFVSASSSLFFSLVLLMLCQNQKIELQLPVERELIPSWKFCQILISVQLRCVWRESIHLKYPKSASDQPLQQLLFWIKIIDVQESLCRVCAVPEIKVTGNLNLFDFNSQVLRCQGVKECILKPRTFVLWTPHKEHTESAIHWKHLAPCRFKCWTNQISIGISQPLKQLTSRY